MKESGLSDPPVRTQVREESVPTERKRAGRESGRIRLHRHFYVAMVLLVAALVLFEGWFRHLRSFGLGESQPLRRELTAIPLELGPWAAERDIPLDKATEDILGTDKYIQRIYADRRNPGRSLQMFVAYWGGVRLEAPHEPTVCRPGAGWTIAGSYHTAIDLPGMGEGQAITVNKAVFSRDYDKQLVVWWDYIHGKNVTSAWMERLRWVLPIFLGGKAGSVVQVQIVLPVMGRESEEQAYASIVEFAQKLSPELAKCLPEAE